jgi:DsbC/DsbD-like thiol-disulfide interchange protein
VLTLVLAMAARSSAGEVPLVEASVVRAPLDGVLWVGVRLDIADGWHLYWENPGDSGLPTRASLSLPAAGGSSDAVVEGPYLQGPERFELPGDVTMYGYERDTTVLFRVSPADTHGVAAVAVSWLACRERCVPGSAEMTVDLARYPRRDRRPIVEAREKLPEPMALGAFPIPVPAGTRVEVFPTVGFESTGASVSAEVSGTELRLRVAPPEALTQGPVIVRLAGPEGVRYVQVDLEEQRR